jgi:hypothetical protein
MAFGYNLDATGDVGHFEEITVVPDEVTKWWFQWDFDERHWQRMSFVPVATGGHGPIGADVRGGTVTIVSESVEHHVSQDRWGQHHTVTLWVHLRNDSGEVITVRPTVFVAPTRFRR